MRQAFETEKIEDAVLQTYIQRLQQMSALELQQLAQQIQQAQAAQAGQGQPGQIPPQQGPDQNMMMQGQGSNPAAGGNATPNLLAQQLTTDELQRRGAPSVL